MKWKDMKKKITRKMSIGTRWFHFTASSNTYKHLFRAGVFVNKDEIQLRVAFNQVDTDNSGSIDVEELSNAMRALGRDLPREQIRAMMDAVDTDKSGEIDFDEFKEMMENVKNAHKLNDDRLDFRNGNHQAT